MVLPSFWIRSFVLHPQYASSSRKRALFFSPLIVIAGLALDFILFFELFALYSFLTLFIHVNLSFGFFLFISGFLQGLIIFDGFLYKQTGIRLEWGYLKLAKNARSFWDSSKEGKFLLFFPILALIILIQSIGLAFIPEIRFSIRLVLTGLGGGILIIFATLFLPRIWRYHFLPLPLYYLCMLVQKKTYRNKHGEEPLLNKNVFVSENEISSMLSEDYPILKRTDQFSGKKVLQISADDRPNIVLIFLESFRAKNVGALGGRPLLTPNFDALAKQGFLFRNFYSNSVKTSRCVTSSLFGIPSDVDGSGVSNSVNQPLISIAEILGNQGYETAYLHNGALKFENQREFFSAHGYKHVMGKDEIHRFCPHFTETSWGVHDEFMMRYGLHWLDRIAPKDKPLFMTLFTISNHHPWMLPATPRKENLTKKNILDRYHKSFQYTDSALGMFIQGMKMLGLSKKTLFLILGDHGYPMGEHEKSYNQQKGLFEEQIHVPLLIYGENRIQNPRIIDRLSSQLDLLPTILDMLNLSAVNHGIGTSLLRECNDPKVFFHNPYMHRFFGLRQGDYKAIFVKNLNRIKLYNLKNDPDERIDISEQHPNLVKNFAKDLMAYDEGLQKLYSEKKIAPMRNQLQDLVLAIENDLLS